MSKEKGISNQKVIRMSEATVAEHFDKRMKYVRINHQPLQLAACDLSAGAFKLWVFFLSRREAKQFDLSAPRIEDAFGIGRSQYLSAMQELIEKGYLYSEGEVITRDRKQVWYFSERPVPKS